MVGRLLVGFVWLKLQFSVSWLWGHVWLNLQFSVSWLVDFQWGSCAQSLVFCVMVGRLLVGFVWLNLQFSVSLFGRLLVGFVWLNLQFSVSWLVDFQWGSCGSIFSFLCHGWQTFSGVQCGSIFSFLCHGWQTFSGVHVAQLFSCGSIFSFLCHGWQTRVAQSLVFCVMVGRLLVGFVWLNLQFSVTWLVDFQWASCGSIFRFMCHGRQTFSGVRVAQSFVFCVMVGRLLVGFVWLNLQISVSWQVYFQWGSCCSIFCFRYTGVCHGWQTFSGVRVAQTLVFCVMVGRLLVGFVWLNLQFSVSWLVDFQWDSCVSIFSFLCHGRQTFSGVRVAQSLVFCVMIGRFLEGFVWLNLQFSVSWSVEFQWGSCGSIFMFSVMVGRHGWQTFSGVRVAQSLVFCVMVGRLLVGFVWLNLQFFVSWLVDFQWSSCGSIFCFLCHGRQTFSGVRVAQSLVFCVIVGRLLVGFVWLNLQFSVSWLVDFSGVGFLCHGFLVWLTLYVFCVMVGSLLVGSVWLNLQFSVSWLVDFQWGSCGSIFSFLCHGWQTFSGVRVAQSLCFLCHGWQSFSGVSVAQSLVFCDLVGRLLVGFVWLNLQISVSWQVDFQWVFQFVWLNLLFFVSWLVDFQWSSCGSIFRFLCHGRYTFSGVRVAQSFVFCVMVGRLLVGFVWLKLQFSVSWLVDFQWGSCGSIFSFLFHGWQTFSGIRVAQSLVFCSLVLCHGWQTFSGVRVAQSLCFLCHGWQTFSGVRVAQSLVFCVMVGRLLVGFVWLNLLFFVSWLVDFQWGSCGSIFSFLCHGRQTFSGVRVAQSLVFCVIVGRLLVGFVWLNLQFSVSWSVDFSGVRVAQSLVFCVMVGRLLVGFVWLNLYVFCVMVCRLLVGSVWLNLQFSVSWLVDFQWGSCCSIFSFLCHGWQTFSGVRVAQSLVFCDLVGRLLVGFVWLNLQISVSWQVDFQWGSCGSIFCFLCHGWQTFSGLRVAQSLDFCVMVGILLVGFVLLNLQFFVSWLVDFQWGSCGSIFSFLCHGRQTFSGVRVAQSLVFCVMVGRLLVVFVWLNLQFSVSWLVDFQWGSCGSIFSCLCHDWQTFSGVRVAQSLLLCVMVGRLLVGFAWLNLQFSVSWLVDFQWDSCGSIFSFLCRGWRLLMGFVWLNLQFSVAWLVDFQWGSCGSIFSFLRHGWHTFRGVRVSQSLVFCVMVGRFLVGFVWPHLQFSVSRLATFSGVRVAQSLVFRLMVGRLLVGSCGSIFRFLCHDWWNFSGVPVAQSFVFCVMVGRLLVGFVWLNLQLSVSWLVNFQWGSCGSIFSFLCHGRQIFSGLRVSQSFVFCVMVGRLLLGFVWLKLQFSVSWLVDFQWGSCGSIFSFLCHV